MYHEDIVIPNFERVEAAILGLQDDVGHVLLTDRNLGPQDNFLGKVYLTVQDLGKYCPTLKAPYARSRSDNGRHSDRHLMSDMSDVSDQDTGEDEIELEALFHEDDSPSLSERIDETEEPEPSFQELLQAIVLWVKDQVVSATNDLPVRAFLLRAYSPKGSRVLMTSTFRAENRAWRPPSARMVPTQTTEPAAARTPELPSRAEPGSSQSSPHTSSPLFSVAVAPGAPVPPPQPNLTPPSLQPPAGMVLLPANVADGALYGTAGAFRALGDSYEQYGRIMVQGVEQLQGMMNQVLGDMGRELHGARGQVTSLVDHVLEKRVREVEIREEHAENLQQTDMRMALARDALGQFGQIAQAFFTARGIPPEMADVLGALSSSPELMASLQKPSVRALLQDPDNLKALATSLENIGDQQEQVRSATQAARAPMQPHAGHPGLPPGYAPPAGLPAPGGAAVPGHSPNAVPNPQGAVWMSAPASWPPPYSTPTAVAGQIAGGYPPYPYPAAPGPAPAPGTGRPPPPGAYPGWTAGTTATHPAAGRGPSQPVYPPPSVSMPPPGQGYPPTFVDAYGRPAHGQAAPPGSTQTQAPGSSPERSGPESAYPESSGGSRGEPGRSQ